MAKAKVGKRRPAAAVQQMVQTRVERGNFSGNRPRAVIVDEVRYESRTAAAAALGISPQAVSIALRVGRAGFRNG